MNNIIPGSVCGDEKMQQYQQLLLERDALRKEAGLYQAGYIHEFGELMTEAFAKKIEVIRRKKEIAYCQKKINHGETVDSRQMDAYIDSVMKEYQDSLNDLTTARDAAKEMRPLPEAECLRIKKIYHDLAKRMHPDIRPELAGDEQVQELWNRIVVAYQSNDLKGLEELAVLANAAIEGRGLDGFVTVPGIGKRMDELVDEIEKIRSTDPYQYRYLLDDPEAVQAKREEYEKEIREYESYSAELKKVMDDLFGQGVTFTFHL